MCSVLRLVLFCDVICNHLAEEERADCFPVIILWPAVSGCGITGSHPLSQCPSSVNWKILGHIVVHVHSVRKKMINWDLFSLSQEDSA